MKEEKSAFDYPFFYFLLVLGFIYLLFFLRAMGFSTEIIIQTLLNVKKEFYGFR